MEMLTAEKKSLGFYITGHPLDSHLETIRQLGAVTSVELIQQETGSRATMAGLIRDLQLRTTKKGDRFAIFRLEDQAGAVKCVLWPEPYRRNSSILSDEATILVTGRAEISDEGMITIIAEKVSELTQAVQQGVLKTSLLAAASATPPLSFTPSATLEPWHAYWINANKAATLVIPPPNTASAASQP